MRHTKHGRGKRLINYQILLLKTVLRTHLIFMRMRIRPGKMDPDTGVKTFFQDLLKLPYKAEITILFSFLFSLISVLKLNKPFRDWEILLSPFFKQFRFGA